LCVGEHREFPQEGLRDLVRELNAYCHEPDRLIELVSDRGCVLLGCIEHDQELLVGDFEEAGDQVREGPTQVGVDPPCVAHPGFGPWNVLSRRRAATP
jgi:hypothetical protein